MIELNKYSPAAKILALKMTGRVGPRTFSMLMHHFMTVDNILLAEEEELLELDGIGKARSKAIFGVCDHLDEAQKQIKLLEGDGDTVVTSLSEDYPDRLHQLNDPPLLLYCRGHLPAPDEKCVALVGSINVSPEGIGMAARLAGQLAGEGVSVISGLARGIDAAGHTGALRAGGKTYAVLPSGFDQIYPAEHKELAGEITREGGLISEFTPDTPTNSGRLMSRNRIVVGLAQAVIIGEVAVDSVGTLDAALCCHELGKLLFVLVGKNNPHFDKLASYGAIPLTGIDEYEMIIKSLV